MPRATWNGVVVAEAPEDRVEVVEGSVYFPLASVRQDLLQSSDTHTTCGWKGVASYYHLAVGGAVNRDAVWTYPEPLPAAGHIRGLVAFWKGVVVER